MADTDILSQGVTLLVYGMGVVVVFLSLLILATKAMSALLARYLPEPSVTAAGINPHHVAAITAALHQHRHSHHQQSEQ